MLSTARDVWEEPTFCMRMITTRSVCALLFLVALPASAPNTAPSVGLNHLALVADSATFAAIASSPFLRDTFALFETAEGADADRVALFGRSTYVEFRRASGERHPGWTSRLALGTDVRGALSSVAHRLTSDLGALRLDSVTRRRDSADVPWFYQLALSDAHMDSTLAVRLVEYHPAFLQRWYGVPKDHVSVARSDVLAMVARSRPEERHYPFLDVVAVKVAAAPEPAGRLVRQCRGIGWRVQSASGGGTACVGPGVRLFVVPSQHRERGIVAFTMRVAGASKLRGPVTRTFGHSVLRVNRSGFATWEFSAP